MGSCEHGNKPLGPLNAKEFCGKLSDQQLLEEDPVCGVNRHSFTGLCLALGMKYFLNYVTQYVEITIKQLWLV
jgi:hypothetical protein